MMPVLPANPDDISVHVPVVIAGGGACGLVAALAARDAGRDVLVLEASPIPRGSSAMSLGALCAVGSREQALHGVDDDADRFVDDVMRKTNGTADPIIARLVGRESGPALDWLHDRHGVSLRLDTNWPPAFGHSRMRLHVSPGRSGLDLMDRLIAACENAGVMILTEARVTDILAEGDIVRAVRYSRPDGTVETVGCDALVLATCGFGGNRGMIAEYIPDMAEARYFGWEGNRGEGILLGMGLGGAVGDMSAYQGLGLLTEPQGIDLNPRFLIEGGIQVNSAGRRFAHELDDISGQGARVIAQPGGVAWVVYDERIHASCADLPQYVQLGEVAALKGYADIPSLARAHNIDPMGLAATLAEIPSHGPDAFGRVFDTPALVPPFRAVKVTGALFHTQGGLLIDQEAHVLRNDGKRLPNLFAGGGSARGFTGSNASGYLPGAGLACAITMGRVAGRAAARLPIQLLDG
nr:FAD-dependent oxidoreductase [Sphingomonas sp. Y57]